MNDAESPIVRYLHARAAKNDSCASMTFEITSRCNFRCKMCYVHSEECNKHADEELSLEQWTDIADQALEVGVMFVLITGGEPLMQGEFLLETMKLLPGIHKVVETSGYADPEIFRKVFEEADLILCDIKLMDSEKHKKYTGVDNKVILENIGYMKKTEKPFVIRIPMIPGITDTTENIDAAIDAANELAPEHLELCLDEPMAYLDGDDLTLTAVIDRTPSTSFVITENAKRAESNECLYVGGLTVIFR